MFGPSGIVPISPAKSHIKRGEPRGIEPLTSAVQSQGTIIVHVRHCAKIPANRRVFSSGLAWLFAAVRVGWCTTGGNESQRRRRGRSFSAIETWLRASFGEFVRPSRHDEVVLVQTTNLVCPPGDRYLTPLGQQCGVVPLLLGLLAYFVGEC